MIVEELRAHDPALLEKPRIVAFNKLDLPAASEAWPAFERARRRERTHAIAISADRGDGLDALRNNLAELLPDAATLSAAPPPSDVVVHRIDPTVDGFQVLAEGDGAFRVKGKRIERIASQTNFDNEESAERFQRDLARMGIEDALRDAGIEPGDVVRIGAAELDWEPALWEA